MGMKPTYEELEKRCEKLELLLKKALEEIENLKEQLNQNSNNSSKPPSTDFKRNTANPTSKSKKPRNGQARALVPLEDVDVHKVCTLSECPHCGSNALNDKGTPLIHQQVELPEVRGVITQYDRSNYCCGSCSANIIAPLPDGVPNSAFGPKLMAFVGTLTGVFHLSKADAQQLVKDLYTIDISDGSITNIEERIQIALRPIYERIHQFVTESNLCKHFDETSWRDSGKTHYVWVASTKEAVCYRIDRYRNREAFQKIAGQLNKIAPVVTDRFSVYNELDSPHQFCIPHLIRNVRRFSQREGPDGSLGLKIEKELQYLCHTHSQYRSSQISSQSCGQRLRYCRDRMESHLIDAYLEGTDKLSALAMKLMIDDFDKMWTFSKFKEAEPTNNLAERDLRKIVLWRKKSYGTRSERGQTFVETITTVSETLKRSGKSAFNFLCDVMECFYHNLETPFINPVKGY